MSEWLPIETAPRNGTSILIHQIQRPPRLKGEVCKCWAGNTAVAAWWKDENDGRGDWVCYMGLPLDPNPCFEPTHWMPLPPPPTNGKG